MLTLLTSKAFELIVFLLQTLTPPVPALWTIARKKLPNFIFFGLPSRNTACDRKPALSAQKPYLLVQWKFSIVVIFYTNMVYASI